MNAMTTTEEVQQTVEDLRRLLDEAPAEWGHWSETDAARPRSDGGWSAKQVVGHLTDSAGVNLQRFLRGQIETGFAMNYPQHEFVALGGYQERSWADVIELWAALNKQVLHVMEHIPAEKLGNVCGAGDGEDWTIGFRIVDYTAHIRHHLRQIQALAEDIGKERP